MCRPIWTITEEIAQEAFLPGMYIKIYTCTISSNLILVLIIISIGGKNALGRKHWYSFLVKS